MWKVCIALHSAPRLLICQMYHTHMQKVLKRVGIIQQLALLTCTLNVAEVFSLLLLSVVPSVEDFTLHKLCFGSFLFFSAFFIASSFYLFRYFVDLYGFWTRIFIFSVQKNQYQISKSNSHIFFKLPQNLSRFSSGPSVTLLQEGAVNDQLLRNPCCHVLLLETQHLL